MAKKVECEISMKMVQIFKKISYVVVATAVILCLKTVDVSAADNVDIVFTHDLHSYVESYDKEIDGKPV